MKIGAIYVRKSVFTDKGESIKNQIDMCKAYARTQDIVINKKLIYCDEGYSGKDTNRPKFKQMLNDLKKNEFDILLCYRLDRISRSLNDFSALIDTMQSFDVSFVSIKEKFDTSTPMGKSMMYIASVFSELERETISERIKDNISNLAYSGRWLGGVTPTGFKSTLMTRVDKNLNKKKFYKLSFIDSEIALVSSLFNVFLKFKDLKQLEEYCSLNDLKSKNNFPFTKNSLKQILTNPVYCIADESLYDYLNSKNFKMSNERSEFNSSCSVLLYKIHNDTLVALSKHKGIINSKDWIHVQKIISANNKIRPRQGTSSIGLLSGLIYCNLCKSLMRVKYGRRTKNGLSYYYLCTLKEKDNKACSSLNLKGTHIDDLIFLKLIDLSVLNVLFDYLLNFLIADRNFNINNCIKYISNQVNIDNSEMIHLQDRLNMLNLQVKSDINSSSYKYILKEIKSIENRILDISKTLVNITNKDDYKNILSMNMDSFNFKEKKYFLNHILLSLYWDNSKITVFFK